MHVQAKFQICTFTREGTGAGDTGVCGVAVGVIDLASSAITGAWT